MSETQSLFPELPPARSKPRKRGYENAGKTANSDKKHSVFGFAMQQYFKARRVFHGRVLLIDMTAHDGEGVQLWQHELFNADHEPQKSHASAELLVRAAQYDDDADVILCELDDDRRACLIDKFGHLPSVRIIGDHRQLTAMVGGYEYAFIINDPCGPKGHGIETLMMLARLMPVADFVIAINFLAVNRIRGTHQTAEEVGAAGKANATSRALYSWMVDLIEWRRRLQRREVAASPLLKISKGFHGRVAVFSNSLAERVTRKPFEVLS